jgi:hypothetical protein
VYQSVQASTPQVVVQLSNPNTIWLQLMDDSLLPAVQRHWQYLVLVGSRADNSGAAVQEGQAPERFRERASLASSSTLGGGDDSVYDTNIIDLLASSDMQQRDMLYNFCAADSKYASVVPFGGHVPSCVGSDSSSIDFGGNACMHARSRVTPTARYSLERSSAPVAAPTLASYLLHLEHASDQSFGQDIAQLLMTVSRVTRNTVRVRITDAHQARFSPPNVLVFEDDTAANTNDRAKQTYRVTASASPHFGFTVVRETDNRVLFDSVPPAFNTTLYDNQLFRDLVFKDRYLEISTRMPDAYDIYGLGERVHEYRLFTNDQTYSHLAMDRFTPYQRNLYGVHPFYLHMHPDGSAHGVYLNNNHGLDVLLSDTKLTYRVMGGELDFFFFTGPTPEQVIQQYHQVIGYPALPPYWALGFHQCRWGYENIQALQEVVAQYKANRIPLDTIWSGMSTIHCIELDSTRLDSIVLDSTRLDSTVLYRDLVLSI